MNKQDAPAFPTVDANRAEDYGTYGLTKREYFAGLAMQALLANPDKRYDAADAARDSACYADALLAELAK